MKLKVKNNYTGQLSVAGVDVGPGKTVGVDAEKFKQWRNGNGAKSWIDQGIIEFDDTEDNGITTNGDNDPTRVTPGLNGGNDRESLVAQAKAMGIEFHPNLGDEKLKALIEAEQEKNS